MNTLSNLLPSSSEANADFNSGTGNTRRNAKNSPKLTNNNRKSKLSKLSSMLAVIMLLMDSTNASKENVSKTDAEAAFKKAAAQSSPSTEIKFGTSDSKSSREWEAYYWQLERRVPTADELTAASNPASTDYMTNTELSTYFDEADQNSDKLLTWEEVWAAEQTVTHFIDTTKSAPTYTLKNNLVLLDSLDVAAMTPRIAKALINAKDDKGVFTANAKKWNESTFKTVLDKAKEFTPNNDIEWTYVASAATLEGKVKDAANNQGSYITVITDGSTAKPNVTPEDILGSGAVNALIASTTTLTEGYTAADTDGVTGLSRKEDIAANLVGNKFTKLAKINLAATTEYNKIDEWELNTKYPMWQVQAQLTKYGTSSKMTILEFQKSQNAKYGTNDKCTKSEIESKPKDIDQCGSYSSCYDEATQTLVNKNCEKEYESCGFFGLQEMNQPVVMMRGCIPTNVCGDTSQEYNYKGKALAGQALCGTDEKPKQSSSKPETVIPSTLKVLGTAGNRCENPTKVIPEKTTEKWKADNGNVDPNSDQIYANKYYWGKEAADCSARALEMQKLGSCNFFMHSDDYPIKGCWCCDKYDPKPETTKNQYNYRIFQTCVDTSTDSQKCFKDVNLYAHNGYRTTHGVGSLTVDTKLDESAKARAKALQDLGSLESDSVWLKENSMCSESLVRFDATTAPGLSDVNWQQASMMSDYFYGGLSEFNMDKHYTTGARGIQFAQLLWKSAKTVGFGYSGSYLVARYCSDAEAIPKGTWSPPTEKNIAAYGLNVCPIGGCKGCGTSDKPSNNYIKGLGYNNCYNDRALGYLNGLRKQDGSPALVLDTDIATKAQTQAKTLSVRGAGASSDTTRPDTCFSISFQQTVASKKASLATSGDAMQDWWNGKSEYDSATGAPKSKTSASETASNNYMKMVWKTADKVGFGIEGSWVVAWVCGTTVTASPKTDVIKANVPAKKCQEDTTNPTGSFNVCFNDMLVNQLNTYRREHVTDDVSLDKTVAAELYKQVTDSTAKWDNVDSKPSISLTDTNFEQMWFYSSDTTALMSETKSVKDMYTNGGAQYDWATWKCKVVGTAATDVADAATAKKAYDDMVLCNQFRQLMWTTASTVAFAVRDNWVVAAVKFSSNKPSLTAYAGDFGTNSATLQYASVSNNDDTNNKIYILKQCIKKGFNECLLNLELAKHNDARLARKETPSLIHDEKASIEIQKQLFLADVWAKYSETSPPALNSIAGGDWANCGESVFDDALNAAEADQVATKKWVAGSAFYTSSDGSIKGTNSDATLKAKEKLQGEAFARVVWKNTKTVGFGKRGKFVVAWYCDKKPDVATPSQCKSNVDKTPTCFDDSEAESPTYDYKADKVNRCFNEAALKAVNDYRKLFKAADQAKIPDDGATPPKYTSTDDGYKYAKELQTNLITDTLVKDCKPVGDAYAGPGPTKLQKGAFDVFYKIPADKKSHKEIAEAMTKSFYDQKSAYDAAAVSKQTFVKFADVSGFTAMVWNGNTKSVFGIADGCAIARFWVSATEAPNQVVAAIGDTESMKQYDTADSALGTGLFTKSTISLSDAKTKYAANVKEECIDAKNVDNCFSKAVLAVQNKYRRQRKDTDEMERDTSGDEEIAKITKKITDDGTALADTDAVTTHVKTTMDTLTNFKGCDMSVLNPLNDGADITDLAGEPTADITKSFKTWYDAALLKYLLTNANGYASDSDAPLAKDFMNMVWKDNTKVSYGYTTVSSKSYAIIWYCPGKAKGPTDYTEHYQGTAGADAKAYKVAESCLAFAKKADGTDAGSKYNKCFAEEQMKAHNNLRYDHLADAVQIDTSTSARLQKQLDALKDDTDQTHWDLLVNDKAWTLKGNTDTGKGPTDDAKRFDFATAADGEAPLTGDMATACTATTLTLAVYVETDSTKLKDFRTTKRPTQALYDEQMKNYEFSQNKPAGTGEASTVDKFTNIVWRKNKFIAAAINDNVAVFAYCSKPRSTTTCYTCTAEGAAAATCAKCKAGETDTLCGDSGNNKTDDGYCDNVKKAGCFIRDSTKGLSDGFNKCFNDKSIKLLNQYRLQHKDQGSRLLKLNEKSAQFLHKQINDPNYKFIQATATDCKKPSDTGYAAATNYCLQSVVEDHETYKLCKAIQYSDDTTKFSAVQSTIKVDSIKLQYENGIAKYDFTKNTYLGDSPTDAEKFTANRFAQQVWKATDHVGLATKSGEYVGLYCPKATEGDTDKNKQNIGEKCMDGTINKCFDKLYRDEANKKRKLHASPDLKEDTTTLTTLQSALNTLAAGDTWKDGAIDLMKHDFSPPAGQCRDIYYKFNQPNGDSNQDFMTKALGVTQWYGYKDHYTFETGKNKYPEKSDKTVVDRDSNYFKNMIWKSHETAAFAVKAPWVVGRFCLKSGQTQTKRTALDNTENINDICLVRDKATEVVSETNKEYNRCYNDMGLKFHNQKRSLRESTKNLKLDTAMAQFIQFEMDKAGFSGTITNKGMYSNCGMNTYKQPDSTTDKIDLTNIASEDWFTGKQYYDMATGQLISSANNDSTKNDKMLQFTQMVWKNTSKVGFGVRGKWVIAFYCLQKGNVGIPADYKANVGEECMKTGEYNKCYAKLALAAHNKKRGFHELSKFQLTLDEDMSKNLQNAINLSNYKGEVITSPALPATCSDNIFELADPAKLATLPTSDVATEYWYRGKIYYDFKNGAIKSKFENTSAKFTALEQKDKDEVNRKRTESENFTRMVWKSTTKVAFAIKDRYVYARYCSTKGNEGDSTKYKENVIEDCLKDDVDVCFQRSALGFHNEKRARHRDSRSLQAYPDASNYIQKVLDTVTNFAGEFNPDGVFSDCGVNVYQAQSETLKREDKAQKATDSWYIGQNLYDYKTGQPYDRTNIAKNKSYSNFANMVWKSTTKAGFGHKGKWVVALYCQTRASAFDIVATKNNIGRQCVSSGINLCLNDYMREEHNKKRLNHEAYPLNYDEDIAKYLQKRMDAASATFVEKDFKMLDVSDDDKTHNTNCDQNVFVYTIDEDTDKDLMTVSKAAITRWYSGNKNFDFKTGEKIIFNNESEKQFQEFSRMMWKASSKTAFGLIKRTDMMVIVGFYCYDKPDVTAAAATVLQNVGKDCVANGYNECFNTRATAYHNKVRNQHQGFVKISMDKDIATAIQKQLDSPEFTGTISNQKKGQYANCGENIYVLTEQSKINQVQLTDMASEFWYQGYNFWDINNGTPKIGNNIQQNSQAYNFAQMMWQKTLNVGFGVKGKYVIGWYCKTRAESTDAVQARTNIGILCMQGSVNKCYNDLALKQVNKYRNNHNVEPLKINNDAAIALQYLVSKQKPEFFEMPSAAKRGWQWTGCYQSVYYETNADARAKVSTTVVAEDAWYNGVKSYDYEVNDFLKKTGYTTENLSCVQTVTPIRQLKAMVNGASKNNKSDCQKICDDPLKACVAYETGPDDHCATYELTSVGVDEVARSSTVTAGVQCHVKTNDYNQGNARNFENMVYKSAETVAFGVKSPWVVAWYCSNSWPANQRDRSKSDRKTNVLPTQIIDGYNLAYNTFALKAHNNKRQLHQGTVPMTIYGEAAKEIQKIMDDDKFNGQMPLEQNRSKQFRDCAQSVYTMTDLSKIGLLTRGDMNGNDFATEYWYVNGDNAIDYQTGKPKPGASQAAVNELLHIIWKTTKKVGFGVKDRWVVAWYCDVRPLSALGVLEVASVDATPSLPVGNAARRLLRSSRRNLNVNACKPPTSYAESNAMDGDVCTTYISLKSTSAKYSVTLKQPGTKVQSVKLTNAKSNASRFKSYRVWVDQTQCGVTPAAVGAGQEVVVTCGSAPNYVSGNTVTIETTVESHLQLAEVSIVGTDGSQAAIDNALKSNVGNSCNKKGYNSCYNILARDRTNDYREGGEQKVNKDYDLTPLVYVDENNAKLLQTEMDKTTFSGKASLVAANVMPNNCQLSYYIAPVSVKNLDTSHAAIDTWFTGNAYYDQANGGQKAGLVLTSAQTELMHDYTRLVWKSTQTVAFGIKGLHVAAWFCTVPGLPQANGAGVTDATAKINTYKAQVLPSCLVVDSSNVPTEAAAMYNKCYNQREQTAHNKKREVHEARGLNDGKDFDDSANSFAQGAARTIQGILSSMPRGEIIKMPDANKRPEAYRNCGENIFVNVVDTRKSLFTASIATDAWYAGQSQYDFNGHAPKSIAFSIQSDQFTQLVWANTGNVAFGVRGDTVVAWYCNTGGNTPRTVSNFKQNVKPVCITEGANRWYSCYNQRAVDRHNRYRIIHGTDSTGFTVDEPAAKALQQMLDNNKPMNNIDERPLAYRNCGQSKFTNQNLSNDNHKVLVNNDATDSWYDGKRQYVFSTGLPKDSLESTKTKALQFTQIVWKGQNGKKVGFGVKAGEVYAWYCPQGNTPNTAQAFKDNVFPAGNEAQCVDDTVNLCYNRKAVLANNDVRDRHGSPDLTMNRDIAKAAQKRLAEAYPTCISGSFTGTTRADRPYKYRDCAEAYYTYAFDSDKLMSSDIAVVHWGNGHQMWDFQVGAPKQSLTSAAQLQAKQFSTMIWKGTNIPAGTKHEVGFGIHCGTVLAWYCPNKPWNDDPASSRRRQLQSSSSSEANARVTLQNVCKQDGSCADSEYICGKDGYDKCYNQMATESHNKKRDQHCAENNMTVDTTMAKELQGMFNLKQERTVVTDRSVAYQDCWENFYQASGTVTYENVRDTNVASDQWYAAQSAYNFNTGQGNPSSVSDQFTAIVWNGVAPNNNFKVAFARRFNYVIAWYCPGRKTNNGINSNNYTTNVKPSTCPKVCKDDLANDKFRICYQKDAIKAHNERRKYHLVPDLEIDYDLAKKAQQYAQNMAAGQFVPAFTRDCYINRLSFPTVGEATKAALAAKSWYDRGINFDWSQVGPQNASKEFTALIWRSSTKAGFGYYNNDVVALYCNTRGNDEGRYACNVCRSGKGCDESKCPLPQTVCSTNDGQGNAEISINPGMNSMRIIATVKKGQAFTLSLGSASLLDTDLLVFQAGNSNLDSIVEDSRTSNGAQKPVRETSSSIQNMRIEEIQQKTYIRFDLTRAFNPNLPLRYNFVKGKTHTIGWRQYRDGSFATGQSDLGTCSLSLSHLAQKAGGTCPDSKKNSTTDLSRQKDCSPKLNQSCYNANTYQFDNNKCPADSSCARWIETRQDGGSFYLDGCLLTQYCGTTGNLNDRTVRFECPNPRSTPAPVAPTPVTSARQGTRCTLQQEDDNMNKKRAPRCSSFRACANPRTNQADNASCETNEQCAKYAWRGSTGQLYAYQHACVLKKYCGMKDASLSGWDFDGSRYDYTTAFECSGVTRQCPAGEVLVAGVCQCQAGSTRVNGYCQVAPRCLSAQTLRNGVCTCPAGQRLTNAGTGCETPFRCMSRQTLVGGVCGCPPGEEVIPYEPGCQARQVRCLSAQTYRNGRCECPAGQTRTQWEPGCYSAGPTCLSGQTLQNGVCTCPPGLLKTTTGTGCQAQQPRCLSAQYPDSLTGRCTCPAGQTVTQYGTGCLPAVAATCFGVQRNENGRCVCPFGQTVVTYGTGCEGTSQPSAPVNNWNPAPRPNCLSAQRLVNGQCICPPGQTKVQYGSGCESSVPRACNPNIEVRAPDGGCVQCPPYQRPQNGVCAAPNCGPREFLDSNGLCFPCNNGTLATADGRSCRYPGRSLLLGDGDETEEPLGEEEASQFYLEELRNIKGMLNSTEP